MICSRASRPTDELIQHAAAMSLESARTIARSIALITRSIEIAQRVAVTCERTCSLRSRAVLPAAPGGGMHIDSVRRLPLTPPKLLDLVDEFRALARSAATPESRAAFEVLAFRYTALAAGYDNECVGSHSVH